MIYVTHDQTEALTFAEQVVVMLDGQVVQAGTPVQLFERPRHTFVGHFIGSPGMNVLPCEIDAAGVARIGGDAVPTATLDSLPHVARRPKSACGRSSSVSLAKGLPVRIERIADVGRFRIVDARHGDQVIKVLAGEGDEVPREQGHLRFDPQRTQVYADGWIVE